MNRGIRGFPTNSGRDPQKQLFASVDTFETTTSTTYAALATAGPSVTVPDTGEYVVEFGSGYARNNSGTASSLMSVDIGSDAAADTKAAQVDSAQAFCGCPIEHKLKRTITAGTAITAKYRSTGGTSGWARRWLCVTRVS